ADLRHTLTRLGGRMASSGEVAWQFRRISFFSIPAAGKDFDKIFELAVEGGADDVSQEDEAIEIVGPIEAFKTLLDALKNAGLQPEEAELRYVANQETELSVADTLQTMRAIESIEDLDDVQNVYSSLKITEEAMAAMEAE
ncbi:YebC/PmpR family DNA-binding transcriptional regulator, partial [bacterium]|nr:YebC/PmpR family DNA-binding transcriptional regulator [bacterium]